MKFKDISVFVIFAVILLAVAVISVLILANELNWDSFSGLILVLRAAEPLSFLIFAIGFSLVSATIFSIVRWRGKQKYLAETWKESLAEGGTEDKQIERMLYEYEREILEDRYQETKDSKYDLDCRSPVFKVEGMLYKQEGKPDPYVEVGERWFVKDIEITEDNYPPLRYQEFDPNDELVVEFSPHSGYVWEVYKIVEGHRDWFMYLNPEIWDQVASGEIKVVGRAPLGSHDLAAIRVGDVITFSHLQTGRRIDNQIETIRHYQTVEEMIKDEGLEDVLPEAKSEKEAVSFYNSLYNYEERIQKGGIYAFRVRPLK